MILDDLGPYGRLDNAEIRQLTGYSRARARRLMNDLCIAGLANPRGRGSHYVPIPREREPADAENAPNNARDPFL